MSHQNSHKVDDPPLFLQFNSRCERISHDFDLSVAYLTRFKADHEEVEAAGYFVWDRFDGSLPTKSTLGRLKATDLLVTVPTSTQWLAHLMGCPSLVIPGPLNPAVLSPEMSLPKTVECQCCFASHTCPQGLDFACMDIAPEKVVDMTNQFFDSL